MKRIIALGCVRLRVSQQRLAIEMLVHLSFPITSLLLPCWIAHILPHDASDILA